MSPIADVTHHDIFRHPEHCVNQIAARTLANGDILAVFNEERFPFHHDSGQTLITRSTDGGLTWSAPKVVLPFTDTVGNWDCGICELADGTLLVNLTITAFFKRGQTPTQPSWSSNPWTKEWGDWTWAFKTQGWLGTYVLRSTDSGESWSAPIPCNVRPLKHGGCRLGCWQLPDGGVLMGLYGRIRGYGEEGEGESTRSALMRSDDGGTNWEYYSTLAYDPASIIDYEEPALLRLADGRLVCFMRTHVNPSGDAKNLVMTVSEDDGFSWTPPKWTNIWGYPADMIALADGRYLMVYGYRRKPFGVRGIVSEDGLSWDAKNEFVIREGGLPTTASIGKPTSSLGGDFGASGHAAGGINPDNPGLFQHIGYPTVVQVADGTIVCAYHEWTDDAVPLQYVRCHPLPHDMNARDAISAPAPIGAGHARVFGDAGLYCAHPHLAAARDGTFLIVFNAAPRRAVVLHPPLDPAFQNRLMRSTDEGRTWSVPEPVPDATTAGVECAGLTALPDGGVLLNQWQFGWLPPEACDPADTTFARPEQLAAGWAASAEFAGLHGAPADPDLFRLARCGGRALVGRADSGAAPFRLAATLDVAPFAGGYGMRGGVILDNGDILLPLSDVPHYRQVFVVRLAPDGRQVGAPVLAASGPGHDFEEPAPLRLAGGAILLLLRDNATRMLHAVRSLDEGATWSAPQRLPIPDYPAALVPLPGGCLALVAGCRRPPFGITLYLGSPSADRWQGPYWIGADLPDIDLGYPAALLRADGDLLVVYYGREPSGLTTIQQSIVPRAVLQRLAEAHVPG